MNEPLKTSLFMLQRLRHNRIALAVACWVAFVLLFVLLHSLMGLAASAVSLLPVLATGWLFGPWAGAAAGLAAACLMLPLMLVREPAATFLFSVRGLTGMLSAVVVGAIAGVLRDSGERRRQWLAERQQADAVARQQSILLEHLTDAVITTDVNFVIQSWNIAAERQYGWTAAEVIGKTVKEVLAPEYLDDAPDAVLAQFKAEGVWSGEALYRRKGAGHVHVLASVSAVPGDAGRPLSVIAIHHDITERKQAEEEKEKLQSQLLQSQKMEAIGRLAGGVAHDFNNLLTAIIGYANFAKGASTPDSPIADDIEQVLRAAERAAGLTRQLLAFSRRQMMALQVADLNDLVLDVNKMLRRLVGEDIELVIAPGPNLWRVRVDPVQIQQVLMNLAVNARDAMPAGGRLTIETANATLDERDIAAHPGATAGQFVTLTMSDDGSGMTEEAKAHLFEPFFTTKELGKGTGLGLATVFGIVKQHGGNISCDSAPGQGTTFRIYLPRVEDGELPAPAERSDAELRGAETILVAEDEAVVRDLVVRSLSGLGYRVLEASNGDEALRMVQEHAGAIDLLVTDVVMPQMGGRQLAKQLRLARPELPVLLISGYATELLGQDGLAGERAQFLPKPFTGATLTRKVRAVLDGRRC